MKFKRKILATADGHIERLDSKNLPNYISYMKESIEYHQPELFIYAGDACDSRNVRAESEEYALLNNYIVELSKICERNNVMFIYVKGTPSHDGEVIKQIIHINKLRIKYVDKPEVMFFRGTSFLLLPELYMPTIESFYDLINDLLKKENIEKVDICVFHAMMDFAIPQLKQVDSHFNQSRSIVIDTDRFLDTFVSKIAIGGHVHKSINYKNCYYLGRFINEKHQAIDSDLYGFKYIEVTNDYYTIINVDNPYLLKYKFINFVIKKDTTINDINNILSKFEIVNEDTVFKISVEKNKESRQTFALWKKMFQPINVKRKFIAEEISDLEVDEVSKIDSISIDKLDVVHMTEKYYKEISGMDLDTNTIERIFGVDVK